MKSLLASRPFLTIDLVDILPLSLVHLRKLQVSQTGSI